MKLTPNRVVALATAGLSLVLAVLPVVGNFDWTSTAGAIAGLAAVAGIALKWLDGWQKHEAEEAFVAREAAWVAQQPATKVDIPWDDHT